MQTNIVVVARLIGATEHPPHDYPRERVIWPDQALAARSTAGAHCLAQPNSPRANTRASAGHPNTTASTSPSTSSTCCLCTVLIIPVSRLSILANYLTLMESSSFPFSTNPASTFYPLSLPTSLPYGHASTEDVLPPQQRIDPPHFNVHYPSTNASSTPLVPYARFPTDTGSSLAVSQHDMPMFGPAQAAYDANMASNEGQRYLYSNAVLESGQNGYGGDCWGVLPHSTYVSDFGHAAAPLSFAPPLAYSDISQAAYANAGTTAMPSVQQLPSPHDASLPHDACVYPVLHRSSAGHNQHETLFAAATSNTVVNAFYPPPSATHVRIFPSLPN